MYKPGNSKPEKSGRKPGTPNKRTQDLIERVEESGKDPVGVLLDMLDDQDPSYKLSAAKELMSYLYPKQRAIDVAPAGDASDSVDTSQFDHLSDEELEALALQAQPQCLPIHRG